MVNTQNLATNKISGLSTTHHPRPRNHDT